MKQLLLPIALLLCLVSCHRTEKKSHNSNLDTTVVVDTVVVKEATPDYRKKLVGELKSLQAAFAAKDKNKIADFLVFPLTDSSLVLFDIDSVFDQQRVKNNGLVTKEMFLDHFDRIYTYMMMDGFNDIFKHLKVDDLLNRDKLEKEHHVEGESCNGMYGIFIEGDEVTLTYGENADSTYVKNHPDEEDVCPGYSSMWHFVFDGKKLYLKKEMTAG